MTSPADAIDADGSYRESPARASRRPGLLLISLSSNPLAPISKIVLMISPDIRACLRFRKDAAIQVLILGINHFVEGRHLSIASSGSLHAERLLVRLSTGRERGDIRTRLDEISATATESATAAATPATRRRLHADEIPDLLLRRLRRSTTTSKRRSDSFGRRIRRNRRGT